MGKRDPRAGLAAIIATALVLAGCGTSTSVESTSSSVSTAAVTTAPTTETDAPAPRSTATDPPPEQPIPVIWDDDGSPDGVIALLALLADPAYQVKAITISCGEAHPEVFAENLTRMLARLGREGVPVAAGRPTPLEGTNAFPEPWRAATDEFWGIDLPPATQEADPAGAAQLIVDTVNTSAEPVMIFLTGNHTNVAEALRLDPSMADRIAVVEIMGGAIAVSGNIASDWVGIPNEVAEWNIWVDPVAADEVFRSSIPLRLVPLDATNHVVWTEADAATWESSGSLEGEMAAEVLRWMLASWFPDGVYAWDVVALADMARGDVCEHTDLAIHVDTAPGNEQGRTIVDHGESPNTSVCLLPDPEATKALIAAAFQTP
ncbi:MAG: nucleoside hydrolase [Actinomycetota bacterium]